MTREELIKALQEQQDNTDIEMAHSIADDLLCDYLTGLGHADIVEEYDKVPKWYA